MMTREELETVLEFPPNLDGRVTTVSVANYLTVQAAARKQLALMPEKCGTCSELEVRTAVDPYALCPTCHGSGKVYPPETVEKIAEAIDSISDEVWGYRGRQAVAVLDALGETE